MSSGHRSRSPPGSGASIRPIRRCGFRTRRFTVACIYRRGKYSTTQNFTNCVPIGGSAGLVGRNAPTGAGRYGTGSPPSITAAQQQMLVASPDIWKVISCSAPARRRSRRWWIGNHAPCMWSHCRTGTGPRRLRTLDCLSGPVACASASVVDVGSGGTGNGRARAHHRSTRPARLLLRPRIIRGNEGRTKIRTGSCASTCARTLTCALSARRT